MQYKLFMQAAGKTFVLQAEGRPEVVGRLSMTYFTHASEGVREMEIVIPPKDYARMERGVPYTLTPRNGEVGYEWKTKGKLIIKKP
jgi:hypothetical protein